MILMSSYMCAFFFLHYLFSLFFLLCPKVVAYLVKPSTEKEGRCRFARHPVAVAYSGRAHAMMSHYWDGSWGTLIAAAAQGSNMGRFIWICALANRYELFGCLTGGIIFLH